MCVGGLKGPMSERLTLSTTKYARYYWCATYAEAADDGTFEDFFRRADALSAQYGLRPFKVRSLLDFSYTLCSAGRMSSGIYTFVATSRLESKLLIMTAGAATYDPCR